MEIVSEINILTEITGTIDNYYGGGETIIFGQPKILTAGYSFVPLTLTIKERSDSE